MASYAISTNSNSGVYSPGKGSITGGYASGHNFSTSIGGVSYSNNVYPYLAAGYGPPSNDDVPQDGSVYTDLSDNVLYVSNNGEWIRVVSGFSKHEKLLIEFMVERALKLDPNRKEFEARSIAEKYLFNYKNNNDEDNIVFEQYLGIGKYIEKLFK